LAIAIGLGGMIGNISGSLFEYIQSLYAFFAPPFAAVFLLGITWRRINSTGAVAGVVVGFLAGFGVKLYVGADSNHPAWLEPYTNQASLNWLLCLAICVVVSLATAPPRADQTTDRLTLNWSKLNIFNDLGSRWYNSVVTWWLAFVLATLVLLFIFSSAVFPSLPR
jgi:SSS family solute:Na+ symporter